jgi:two-component system, NarL family, response regulator DevR
MIRVFLVDDHELVRRGLRDLLVVEGDIRIVGGVGTAADAAQHIPTVRPDVMVLDVRLPDGTGIEVCRDVRAAEPGIAALMLTSFDNDEAQFAALIAGAHGHVLKQIRGSDLILAIRRVAGGQSLLDAEVAARIRRRLDEDAPAGLSDVEGTVLALIVGGSTNPEIVERTGLGADALHETVTSLLAKLGLDRATGLTDLGRALIAA